MADDTGGLRPTPQDCPDDRQLARRRARAAAYWHERMARRKAAGGPLEIDSGPTVTAMIAFKRAGLVRRQLATVAECSEETLSRLIGGRRRPPLVWRSTAERLLEAAEKLLAAKRVQLDDLEVALEALAGQLYPARRWPAEALRAAVRDRGISIKAGLDATDRRYFYRATSIPTERADDLCFRLGLMPEDVWGSDWTGSESSIATSRGGGLN